MTNAPIASAPTPLSPTDYDSIHFDSEDCPSDIPSTPSPPSSTRSIRMVDNDTAHPDSEYYLVPLVFKVENRLFRLPREYFLQESMFFRDMFELARPAPVQGLQDEENSSLEGDTDSNPYIVPEQITTNAFGVFAELLFGERNSGSPSELQINKDEAISLLELLRLWDINPFPREIILSQLIPILNDTENFDPLRQWILADLYNVTECIRPALERLIRRSEPLGVAEYEALEPAMLLKIAGVRECCYPVLRDTIRNNGRGQPFINDVIAHWRVDDSRGVVNINLDQNLFQRTTIPVARAVEDNEMDTRSTTPSQSSGSVDGVVKNAEFFFEKVVFKVENQLFKVPNQPFAQHSSVFRTNFKKHGFSKYDVQNPYVIEEDVKVADFENLLRLFFPSSLIQESQPTPEEWASILRLSSRWEMKTLKDRAIQQLNQTVNFSNSNNNNYNNAIAHKFKLAQEFKIDSWFIESMCHFITREDPISEEEYHNVLGKDQLLKVLDLRERCHLRKRFGSNVMISQLRDERGVLPSDVDLSGRLDAEGLLV